MTDASSPPHAAQAVGEPLPAYLSGRFHLVSTGIGDAGNMTVNAEVRQIVRRAARRAALRACVRVAGIFPLLMRCRNVLSLPSLEHRGVGDTPRDPHGQQVCHGPAPRRQAVPEAFGQRVNVLQPE